MTHAILFERRSTDDYSFYQRVNGEERVEVAEDSENLGLVLCSLLQDVTPPHTVVTVVDHDMVLFLASYDADGKLKSAKLTFHDDYEFTAIMMGLEESAWDGGRGETFLWQGGKLLPGDMISVLNVHGK